MGIASPTGAVFGRAHICVAFGPTIDDGVTAAPPFRPLGARCLFARGPTALGLIALVGLSGCPEEQTKPAPAASATATASATASASGITKTAASDAPGSDFGAVCEPMNRERWVEEANRRTGLTAKTLPDGRLVVGVGVKDHPYLLEYDAQAKGSLRRLPADPGDPVAKPPKPGEGERHLQRVTPSAKGYFIDYRDKYRSGRRRIACGMLNREPYVVFDGEPLLDVDTSGRKPGQPPPALPTRRVSDPSPPKRDAQRELRDCRTMSDATGEDVWAVGSELVGQQIDGKTEWYMDFFIKTIGGQSQRILLQRNALGPAPDKLHTLEAPVAHPLADGGYVLAGRYRGRMIVWLLDRHKQKTTVLHRYDGGYPGLPRIVPDGDRHRLLVSQRLEGDRWGLRTIPLETSPELPEKLLPFGEAEASQAEPTLARLGDQSWLQYHQDDRRRGRVMIVPVDETLKPAGERYQVTGEGVEAYESHLFALPERGWLASVYISRAGDGHPAELRSGLLKCRVKP